MTTIDAIVLIEEAKSADSLLGAEKDKRYRELAKLVHPDVAAAKLKDRAEKAFRRLTDLCKGDSGKTQPLETLIGNWVVGSPFAKGDICDVYKCSRKDDPAIGGIFKIARSPKDADLMEQERFTLKYLVDKKPGNFLKYIPTVVDSFEASGRRANVIAHAEGLSLSEIATMFGPSLDPRHLVWFINRALSVLGFIHANGVVHGAVLPGHLIYGPKTHSLTLIDWCYAVTAESKKHIPAVSRDYLDLYPPEVSRKAPAIPATDIYMLFASIKNTKAMIPKRFKALFDWCMAASPNARPREAWEIQDRLLVLAAEEFGPSKFIELVIPVS